MNAATPTWIGIEQCQSDAFLAATSVRIAQSGATMNPSLKEGSMHLEKVPT